MKLSIITVNFNNVDGLEKTILSVIRQKKFDDYEYIIIDGKSTDGSVDIIKKYQESIDYWVSEPDKGIYNAMNKGVLRAHGDYCIFMNSGDVFYDRYVFYNVFKKHILMEDIVYGNHFYANKVSVAPNQITGLFLFNSTLCHQSIFVKTEHLKRQLYKEDYKVVSDWIHLFELLIFNNASYKHIDIVICQFDKGGMSSNNWQLLAAERKRYLMEKFPKRLYADYELFGKIKEMKMKSPYLLDCIYQVEPGSLSEFFFKLASWTVIALRKIKHTLICLT